MARNWNWWSRKLHRWGALACAIPMFIVVVSGILLQVKKQVAWVQPPTAKASAPDAAPQIDWQAMLEAAKGVEEAAIEDWSDVDRLDVRVNKGLVKIQANNHWEIQVDLADAQVLSSNYRRSDWIEALHDGSYFHEQAKLWVFLPNGLLLLGLLVSGMWLWYIPFRAKRRQKIRQR